MSAHHAIWSRLLADVRQNHPEIARAWFTDLQLTELDRGTARIRAANPAQLAFLERNCRSAFAAAAQAASGRLISVIFDLTPVQSPPPADPSPCDSLDPNATFAAFVSAPENRLALAAVSAAAERPGETYNPLHLYGPPETGKSHLLQAFCHALSERHPPMLWRLRRCEDFVREAIEAAERDTLPTFLHTFRTLDAFILDDVHELDGRERSQESFFHAFNAVMDRGGQVITAGTQAPADMPGLAPRLISRLSAGLVVAMETPCRESRAAILRTRARLRGIEVPDDVVNYLSDREGAGLCELEQTLISADALAQGTHSPMSVELAVRAMKD